MAGRADWITFSGLSSLCSLVHIGGFVWANSVGPGKVVPLHWLCKQRIWGSRRLVASLSKSLRLQLCTLRPRDSTLTSISPAAWFRSLLQQVPSAPSAPIQSRVQFSCGVRARWQNVGWEVCHPGWGWGTVAQRECFYSPPPSFSPASSLSLTPATTAQMKPGHAPSERRNRQLPPVGLEGPDLKRNSEK